MGIIIWLGIGETQMQNKENSRYEIIYKNGKYVAPYIDLLKDYSKDEIFMDPDRIKGLAETLQELFDAFRLAVNVVDATATSLAITFKVIVDPGESVKAIYKIKVDIEVALGSFVEMEYMPEEENTILISAKNIDRPLIGLKNVIGSKCFMETLSPLSVAAGIDVQGNELIIDIAEAPHILVAGTTGSGKSIFIDDIILSILFNASPEEVRLLLIDPKYVELMAYNGIPHLLGPVIKDADEALNSFLWIEDEIMRRYDSFSKKDAKNIEAYNAIVSKVNEVQLPRILITTI